MMDCRVKPGNDVTEKSISAESPYHTLIDNDCCALAAIAWA
jgi:hypothetical protein